MNGIDELASLIVKLRTDDIAASVLAKLRLHIADTVGAWIAAARIAEGKALIAYRNRQRPTDDGIAGALATHCALARLSEIDDIHLGSMTTPGSIVIPAAMTLAATLPGGDSGNAAAAILAGYEAMIRLGLAINGPSVLYRGIWPTYFAAGFATAAAAARLMRLDQNQTAHALALALTMASPSVGQHHAATTARWFLVGNAARGGFLAAQAAQAGFTADTSVLQSRLFSDVYVIAADLGAMSGPADGTPALAGVSFKPWCAARQTMTAVQGLREILHDGVAAGDMFEVTAYVLPPHLKMIDHGVQPGNRASFLTSLPYQLGMAALHPDRMLDLDQPAETTLPAVQAFMARVRVTADDALLADYPNAWPARIVVTTASGRIERRVHDIPGDPARPSSEPDLRGKFQRGVARCLGNAAAERLWQSSLAVLHSHDALVSMMRDLDRVMAS